jgi:hypothetical protein
MGETVAPAYAGYPRSVNWPCSNFDRQKMNTIPPAPNRDSEASVAEENKLDARELFKKEKRRLVAAVKIATTVSKAAANRAPAPNIVMASYVFTRMCICADTLLYVLQRDIGNSKELTLDHYSIGVLARNIIESTLMFHYLSEDGVSEEDWQVRRGILTLHDVTLRVRLFKGLSSDKEYQLAKTTMEEMRRLLQTLPAFKAIDVERQKKLLSGQEMYVKGMRSILKLLAFDDDYFDGMYAYLSSQVHISPSSFFWTEKRLSFNKPASYQYYFASYAVAHAREFFLRSAIRLTESDDAVRQKIDQATFDSMSELAAIPFGD